MQEKKKKNQKRDKFLSKNQKTSKIDNRFKKTRHNNLRKNIWDNVEQEPGDIIGIYAQWNWDYGFIDVEGKEKGYYVFGHNSMNALPWEKVLASVKIFKGREEATIKKVLERRQDPIVWIYNAQARFGFVVPKDKNIKKDIFVAGRNSMNAKDGQVVAVKIIKWEGKSPEGEVVKVLGKPGEKWVDILGLALEYGARIGFGWAIKKELAHLHTKIPYGEYKKRKDLRDLFTITIDGEDSKDLDDAISIEKGAKNNYILYVHIADVGHYVPEDHAIDKEARRRGTSIYLVNQVIPMLPKELSNGLCSLNPNEEKLTLTCQVEVNSAWHIVKTEVFESIIKSDFRMTYKEVDQILIQKDIMQWDELMFGWIVSKNLIQMLQDSEKLREILAVYKKELWVLDFDFPETKIIVDEDGNPTEFKKYERYASNKLIEEFMVLANEAVSKKFSNLPFLYRVHNEPSEEDVEKLFQSLAVFSYNVPQLQKIKPKDYQVLLAQIKLDSKEKLLSKMVLRSLSKAVYSTESQWHFGLALDYYSHFTSPIRRYPDLMIHRIIKEKIHKHLDTQRIASLEFKLPWIAKKCSAAEIKAEKLEYKVRDLMSCKFMKDKIGEVFPAIVSWVIWKWIFVELENTIEWFVELSGEVSNGWQFNPEIMSIENIYSQKKYTIGDALSVELIKVDEDLQRIDFEIFLD